MSALCTCTLGPSQGNAWAVDHVLWFHYQTVTYRKCEVSVCSLSMLALRVHTKAMHELLMMHFYYFSKLWPDTNLRNFGERPALRDVPTINEFLSFLRIDEGSLSCSWNQCESWTIKKAEHQRTDTFKLWCQRRLLSTSPPPSFQKGCWILNPNVYIQRWSWC